MSEHFFFASGLALVGGLLLVMSGIPEGLLMFGIGIYSWVGAEKLKELESR